MISLVNGCLCLSGSLTLQTHSPVLKESEDYDLESITCIDLSQVSEVDSSALALIFAWQRRAHCKHVELRAPPAALVDIANLYDALELLNCADTKQSHHDPVAP